LREKGIDTEKERKITRENRNSGKQKERGKTETGANKRREYKETKWQTQIREGLNRSVNELDLPYQVDRI